MTQQPAPEPSPDRDRPHAAGSYRVESRLPPAPPLPGEVIVDVWADDVIDTLASELVIEAMKSVHRYGDFHLALSGGSTPLPLYRRLMLDPNYRQLPWKRTHLWIVDERCVPFDDLASNFREIRETIIDHADIPAAQVHPMPAESRHADLEYEKTLRETLCWRDKGEDRLDFVVLGMGADGHTASLFPHSDVLHEKDRLVRLVDAPLAKPRRRVTMTYPLINAARFIAVLVLGSSKAATIQRLATGHDSFEEMPIKGVHPTDGALKWYLDAAAVGNDAD